jgi:hypothetical protein
MGFANVNFPGRRQAAADDKGGEPPDDGGMEERVKRLEVIAEQTQQQLVEIGTRLTKLEIRSESFATKDDVRAVEVTVSRIEATMHRELDAQTWKLVGVAALLFSAAFGLAKLVH